MLTSTAHLYRPDLAPTMVSGEGYRARFVPQAWIGGEPDDHGENSINVQPEGEVEWTPLLISRSIREAADEMRGVYAFWLDEEPIIDANAPRWVREWTGPFMLWIRKEVAE